MRFGEALKKARNDNKDSLRDLGKKAGFSHVYMAQIEKSERPVSKNAFAKLLEIYPEHEKELMNAYLEEIIPDGIIHKVLKNTDFILEKGSDKALVNYLYSVITPENRKAVLELMVLQMEVEARERGCYEADKEELEEIKKEIEKL